MCARVCVLTHKCWLIENLGFMSREMESGEGQGQLENAFSGSHSLPAESCTCLLGGRGESGRLLSATSSCFYSPALKGILWRKGKHVKVTQALESHSSQGWRLIPVICSHWVPFSLSYVVIQQTEGASHVFTLQRKQQVQTGNDPPRSSCNWELTLSRPFRFMLTSH